MIRHKAAKSICVLTLAIMLAGLLCPANLTAYADGNVTISVVGLDEVTDFPGFDLELYKVGVYNNNGEYSLDQEYADLDVSIPSGDLYDKDQENGGQEWFEQWMSSAASLANHIDHPADGEQSPEPVKVYSGIRPGSPVTFSAENNVLYLLKGNTVRHDNALYTPLPMYLCSINGAEVNSVIKLTMEHVVFKHSLMKIWDDEDNKAGVRPAAIEMGIYYGSQLIDRVTLGGEKGEWTYSWDSEESGDTYCYIGQKDGQELRKEFTPGADDTAWSVREFTRAAQIQDPEAREEAANLAYYKPEYDKNYSDSLETFVINNPYEPENPPDNPPGKVKTGDDSKPYLWIGVAGAAVLALIIAMIKRRKDGQE